MAGKAEKKIRKYLRKELKAQARVEAKWIFPVLFTQFFFIMKPVHVFSVSTIKIPWIKVVKTNREWFEITKFPKYQFRFRFRFVREAEMNGKVLSHKS